ncbi:MAG: hypothetical protein AB7O21_17160 [Gammaproteobacteria bacterium]
MQSSSHPDAGTLLSALVYLQIQFAQQRRLAVAEAIDAHLALLEAHPEGLPLALVRSLPQLRAQWQAYLLFHREDRACTRRECAEVAPVRRVTH